MFIVTGKPRSGTSLTMNILFHILGEDRIVGDKFPLDGFEQLESTKEQLESTKEQSEEMIKFLYTKRRDAFEYNNKRMEEKTKEAREARKKHAKMMNPRGFYEKTPYSVKGLSYNRGNRLTLPEWLDTEGGIKCMKIVSQGLLNTDPRFVTKLVYVIRHPHQIATSQESLITQLDSIMMGETGYKKPIVNSPSRYLKDTHKSCLFLIENPDIPVHFFNYNDLISDPKTTIGGITDFLELPKEISWQKCKHVIDPTLKRSKPREFQKGKLWEEALHVYGLFNDGKFQEVIDFLENPTREIHQENTKWICPRLDRQVVRNECISCTNISIVRNNYKDTATRKGVAWEKEPCLFECGMNLSLKESETLTIEESIANNHWL